MTAIEASERPHGGESNVTSEAGEVLAGRYRLGARIGSGSTGIVYRAEDLMFTRPVAVRLLTPALARGDGTLERLEARLHGSARMLRDDVRALRDIVDIIDLGHTDGGQIFVVTEILSGESLAAVLTREGPLPWRRLRPLVVRACQIVHLSHEHGIVRQDLQTRNLYPVRDKAQAGTLRVYSPGLGVAFGERLWSCLDPEEALMLARYAAPEQISGGAIDRRTDVYALGVILYECLTGQVPFTDPRPPYVLAAHLLQAAPPFSPEVRRRGVPAELEGIVLRALAKDPDDRWPTVKALANAMAAIEFGPCDRSGVLEAGDLNDLTDLLEPEPSGASMRVDRARLSGQPGLAPAAPAAGPASHAVDPASSASELAWREILDAAESAVGAVVVRARRDDIGASDSSLDRGQVTAPDDLSDSTPTIPYGAAEHSAPRWPAPAPVGPASLTRHRRAATWAVAAGLALVTAAGVSYVLRPPAVSVGFAPAPRPSTARVEAPRPATPPSPAPVATVPAAPPAPRATPTAGPESEPPPAAPLPAAPTASPVLSPDPEPPPASDPEPAPPKARARPRARPQVEDAPDPAPTPRKAAPGANLPDRSGHELPDPGAVRPGESP